MGLFGGRWGVARHPSFWLVCTVLFATNAAISALRGDWWLVILEAVTALLTLVSAVAATDWRPLHQPSNAETPK